MNNVEQRIEKLKDVFMLASGIVQLKYVQDIGNVNEVNFKVGMTLTRSAYLLKINVSTLSKRIKRMNLHWRGKKNLRGIA